MDLRGPVRFRLGEISLINSCGVHEWIQAMGPAQKRCVIEYDELSVPMVKQFNAVVHVRGGGTRAVLHGPLLLQGL